MKKARLLPGDDRGMFNLSAYHTTVFRCSTRKMPGSIWKGEIESIQVPGVGFLGIWIEIQYVTHRSLHLPTKCYSVSTTQCISWHLVVRAKGHAERTLVGS